MNRSTGSEAMESKLKDRRHFTRYEVFIYAHAAKIDPNSNAFDVELRKTQVVVVDISFTGLQFRVRKDLLVVTAGDLIQVFLPRAGEPDLQITAETAYRREISAASDVMSIGAEFVWDRPNLKREISDFIIAARDALRHRGKQVSR